MTVRRIQRLLGHVGVTNAANNNPYASGKAEACRHSFTTFDGHSLAYYTVGGSEENDGPAVILAHGFTAESVGNWFVPKVAQKLAQRGFRTFALDLRGHGKSARLINPEEYADDAEARDILELAKHLNLAQYSLVGYSHGSIEVAKVLDSEKVCCAVLGGIGDAFTELEWRQEYGVGVIAVALETRASGEAVSEAQAGGWVGPPAETERAKQAMLALAAVQRGQSVTTRAELRACTKPVLTINGDRDDSNGSKQALAGLFQHGESVTVAGDHGTAVGDPAFASALIDFLGRHAR